MCTAMFFLLLCFYFEPVLASDIHYRCPGVLYEGVESTFECWQEKTGAENDKCLSQSRVNLNLISESGNLVVYCDNKTLPGVGSCFYEDTPNRTSCTIRLMGNRTILAGRVPVCSFCLGITETTNGCGNLTFYDDGPTLPPGRNIATLGSPPAPLAVLLAFILSQVLMREAAS